MMQRLPWVVVVVLLVVIVWQQWRIERLVRVAVQGPGTEAVEGVSTSPRTAPPTGAREQAASRVPAGLGGTSTPQPPTSTNRPGDALPTRAGPPDRARLLAERKRSVRELGELETGERMFEELKTVTGDDPEALETLLGLLTREGRLRRQLERKAEDGEISREQLARALEFLELESEGYAERVLEPWQFDRYREVRQSWARGREHPDRDSTD